MGFKKGHKLTGGHVKTEKKAISARVNGKLGGRPADGEYKLVYYCKRRKKDIVKYYKYQETAYAEAYKRGADVYKNEMLVYRAVYNKR